MRTLLTAMGLLVFSSLPLLGFAQSANSPIAVCTSVNCASNPTTASSNQFDDTETAEDPPLETIVVTASRLAQPAEHALAQTTSFDAKAIATSTAIDLPSLLPFVSGAQIIRNGGMGAANSFYLRGANTTQTLVLIDGVRLDSASLGSAQLSQLMLDDIERIEVVNGNVSALYGSHAVGGVVQIFTKQGKSSPTKPAFSTEYGSFATQRHRAAINGSLGNASNTTFHLGYSRLITDGFSSLNPRKVPNANPDAHGFNNTNLSLALKHQFNADWEAGLRFYESQGTFIFNNAYDLPTDINRANNRLRVFSTFLNGQFNAHWLTQLLAASSEDHNTNFLNNTFNSRFNTTNYQFTWQNEFALNDLQKILFGYEHLTQRLESDVYAAPNREVDSSFAGYQTEFGPHQFQFNLRRDQYNDFGIAHSYYAGYGYALDKHWKLITSVSNAFRAPSFNDLYYPNYGNPALRPERSHSAEVALQYTSPIFGTLRLTAFQTYYRDLIESVQTTPGVYHAQNVGRAKIQGLETSLISHLLKNEIRFTATAQNPIDQQRGTILPRRARHFASLSVSRPFAGWQIGGEWLVSGARDDSGSKLAGYALVNLKARYNLSKACYIVARVENLFNKQYELAYAYQTPQRSAYVMFGWQPH